LKYNAFGATLGLWKNLGHQYASNLPEFSTLSM